VFKETVNIAFRKRELREERLREADWEYINSLPPPIGCRVHRNWRFKTGAESIRPVA